MSFTGDVTNVITEIDGFLTNLEGAIKDNILKYDDLPVIGDKLDDIGSEGIQFIDDIQVELANAKETVKTVEGLQEALYLAIKKASDKVDDATQEAADFLKDFTQEDILVQQIPEFPESVGFDFKFKFGKNLKTDFSLDDDLPGLGLEVGGKVDTSFGIDYHLKFRVDLDGNVYIDTAPTDELQITLDNSIVLDDNTKGKLGPLTIQVNDNPDKKTGFKGTFAVDLKNEEDDQDTELPIGDIFSSSLEPTFQGSAAINLQTKATFNDSQYLPSVKSDIVVNWGQINNLGEWQINSLDDLTEVPTISFDHVSVGLGKFFSGFAGPILEKVNKITEPVQPVIDILTKKIDLKFAKFTLWDIIKNATDKNGNPYLDDDDKKCIEQLMGLSTLINSIPTDLPEVYIDLGSYTFGKVDVKDPNNKLEANEPSTNLLKANALSLLEANALSTNSSESKNLSDVFSNISDQQTKDFGKAVDDTVGLSFPMLTEVKQVVNLLLGKDATLFAYDLPNLGFKYDFSQFYRIYGPFGITMKGAIGADLDLKFGFDNTGVKNFLNSENVEDILDGFYISDTANADGTGPDVPEASLNASIKAFVAANVGIAEAGAGGGLVGNLDLNLKDRDNDGKIRWTNEIAPYIFNDPLCLFDMSGAIKAELSAYVTIGKGWFSWTKEFNGPSFTLAEFNYSKDCSPANPPKLANNNNGSLSLNIGPNAGNRVGQVNPPVDTIAPTVNIFLDDLDLTVGETSEVTFEFSEAVKNFDPDDITVNPNNGTLSNLVVDGANPNVYYAIFTPTSEIKSDSNVINVGTGYEDLAGNPGTEGTSAPFTIDTSVPLVDPPINPPVDPDNNDYIDLVWEVGEADGEDGFKIYYWGNGETVKLSNDGSSPDLSWNNVVWSEWDGNDDEIYYWDGQTTIQLTDNDTDDRHPSISLAQVVWSSWNGNTDEVWYWDGYTKTLLTDNGYVPDISWDSVVWVSSHDLAYGSKIEYRNWEGQTTTLPTYSDLNWSPSISGNNVVWVGYDGNDDEIYYWDGQTTIPLTDNNTDDSAPDIFLNKVVWVGYDGNDDEIYYWDGQTTGQLTDNNTNDLAPSISGNNVVWSSWDGNDYEIYYWDGDEQRTTQLTNNDVDDLSPRISTAQKGASLSGSSGADPLISEISDEPAALALTADEEVEPAALLTMESTTATEPGSTLDTATPIDPNPDTPGFEPLTGFQLVSDQIGDDSYPSDYYRFEVSEQGLLTLLLNNLSAGAKIDLLDSTGAVITSSTQTGTKPRLMDVSISPGTYYVKVVAETTGETTNYDLTLTMNEDEIFRVEHIGDDANGEIVKVSGMNFDENGEPFENFSQQESGIKEIVADGGKGNDILEIKAGVHSPAKLSGGDGGDQIQGGDGDDILKGDNGQDQINGALGADNIEGGNDNDYLLGGAGADLLNGGEGSDTASYSTSPVGVNIDLTTGQSSGGDGAGDQFISIENLEGSPQDDFLKGNGEDNILEGGAGADNLDGGDGNDTALYATSPEGVTEGVTVNLATGFVSGGYANGDVLNSIENIGGSLYNDNLTGNDVDNAIDGNQGDDYIDGGLGADNMSGGDGNDFYVVDNPGDIVTEEEFDSVYTNDNIDENGSLISTKKGIDTVQSTVDYTLPNHVENLILVESATNATGNALNNTISGNDSDNTIDGGGGADLLKGGKGDDTYIINPQNSAGTRIEDTEGNNNIQIAGVTPSLSAPAPGIMGIKRQGNDLIIDTNMDGTANPESDLVIPDFVIPSDTGGTSSFQNINGIPTGEIIKVIEPDITQWNLDIDGNGEIKPFTDGILVLRYMLEFTGDDLTKGAIASSNATRTTPDQILSYLQEGSQNFDLDIDGNGEIKPFTDGILVLRHMLEFAGDDLTKGAIGPNATRTLAQIESHLEQLDTLI